MNRTGRVEGRCGQDVLLATKLHVPRPQPGFVPRRRLVQGLARGRVLVCAPAGSGKTALLADWARGGGRPVAWLSLDGGDNDPARFWRYAVAALDRARPGLAGRLGPLPTRSAEGLVTAVINELAADPGPDEVLLVLDDYHLVDSGPVRHALAAEDAAWAARLVERHVETLLGRSEGATLRRWLSALPAESVRMRPRLCLAQAYGAAMGFHRRRADLVPVPHRLLHSRAVDSAGRMVDDEEAARCQCRHQPGALGG